MAERIELILAPGAGSINSEFQVTELRVGNSSESFILRRLNRSKNIGHSYSDLKRLAADSTSPRLL